MQCIQKTGNPIGLLSHKIGGNRESREFFAAGIVRMTLSSHIPIFHIFFLLVYILTQKERLDLQTMYSEIKRFDHDVLFIYLILITQAESCFRIKWQCNSLMWVCIWKCLPQISSRSSLIVKVEYSPSSPLHSLINQLSQVIRHAAFHFATLMYQPQSVVNRTNNVFYHCIERRGTKVLVVTSIMVL